MVNGKDGDDASALAGRVALLTDPTSTIGAAIARALVAAGARVALATVSRDSAQLDALVTQIREAGGQALSVPAVFDTRARAHASVGHVIEVWGRLDILVVADGYNATGDRGANGGAAQERLGQPHPAVRSLLHIATAALPVMTRQGGGDVVVVAPVAGRVLRAEGVASARTALEVAALCGTLRRQAGSRGIRIAVVEPDLAAVGPDANDPVSPTAEDVAAAILYVLTRPPHLSIAEILLRPTDRWA